MKSNRIDRIMFRIRWLMMSERGRYAYLWSRTKDLDKTECHLIS